MALARLPALLSPPQKHQLVNNRERENWGASERKREEPSLFHKRAVKMGL